MQIIKNEYLQNKIKNALGDCYYLFQKEGAFLAGGAITSLFCRAEVNDYDIYLQSKYSAARVVYDAVIENCEIGCFQLRVNSKTNKSLLCSHDDVLVQLISFQYFKSPQEIFDTFDFTINMGAFCFETEQFYLHDDFLTHNSQRILKYNHKTAYPIISALRVKKYAERGYYISKMEMMKILASVTQIKISSWEEAEEHLAGMYGETIKGMSKEKEFSFEELISTLSSADCHDGSPTYATNIKESIDEQTILNWFNIGNLCLRYYKGVGKDGMSTDSPYGKIQYVGGSIVNGGTNGIYCRSNPKQAYKRDKFVILKPLQGAEYNGSALVGDVLVERVLEWDSDEAKEIRDKDFLDYLAEEEHREQQKH